ncbi:MAG: hypothetical protein Q8J78_17530, partial [Moraxellaceae bacterium]|nr:hypothetical protein [Moraxellaceae bacterium]
AADAAGAKQIEATIRSLDAFLVTTSVPGQKQILQLFDLLSMPLTRYSVVGLAQDWGKSSAEEIEAFLDAWSKSRFELLRGGYLALSQLIGMSWYMQPESWVAIGYQPPLVTA